jgi:hypothetical protein
MNVDGSSSGSLPDNVILWTNHYCCPCGEQWEDQWDCQCNDRCPACNKEIEPFSSIEVGAEVAPTETVVQAPDFPQWVVVENAGTDDEDIWSDHDTLPAALKELENCGGRDNGFDLMKRRPDGTLTTEY